MKTVVAALALTAMFVGCTSTYKIQSDDIVLENERARFVIGADGKAKSLIVKESGEEMLDASEGRSVFSATQDRPFNNEIKLVFPHFETT